MNAKTWTNLKHKLACTCVYLQCHLRSCKNFCARIQTSAKMIGEDSSQALRPFIHRALILGIKNVKRLILFKKVHYLVIFWSLFEHRKITFWDQNFQFKIKTTPGIWNVLDKLLHRYFHPIKVEWWRCDFLKKILLIQIFFTT